MTDSAASATAWTTGVKSYNGALGVDIHEKDHTTILEMAKLQAWRQAMFLPLNYRMPLQLRWLRM